MSDYFINLNDPEFTLWDSLPNEYGHPVIEAAYSSNKSVVYCPHCHVPGKYIKKDGVDKKCYKKWEIVNGEPAQVILHAQLWTCKSCGLKQFKDPFFPYAGKNRTTKVFDKWLGQRITDNPTLLQKVLATEYRIPVEIVNKALKEKLRNAEKSIECAVPVKVLWLVPFKYHKQKLLAIFGQNIVDKNYCEAMRIDSGPASFVFFGISRDYSLEGAKKGGRLLITNDIEIIYCPYDLITPELKQRYKKVLDSSFATYPEPIHKILNLITVFGKGHYSVDQLELLLMHQDPARREELRRKGELPFHTNFVTTALSTYKKSYTIFDYVEWHDYDILFYSIDINALEALYNHFY